MIYNYALVNLSIIDKISIKEQIFMHLVCATKACGFSQKRQSIAEMMGVSKPTLIKIQKKCIDKGFCKKLEDSSLHYTFHYLIIINKL